MPKTTPELIARQVHNPVFFDIEFLEGIEALGRTKDEAIKIAAERWAQRKAQIEGIA